MASHPWRSDCLSSLIAGMIGGSHFECHGFILRIPVKNEFPVGCVLGKRRVTVVASAKGLVVWGCGFSTVGTQAVPVSVLQVSFSCPPSFFLLPWHIVRRQQGRRASICYMLSLFSLIYKCCNLWIFNRIPSMFLSYLSPPG